jgi:ferric-dicitrate binding protein FerR (iron transport regulator)
MRHSEDQVIASLLRMAGPRPAAPAERRGRVRAAVHAHWQQTVRWRKRRRAVLWAVGSLATAAAALLTVGLGQRRGLVLSPAAVSAEGRIEAIKGSVRSGLSGALKAGDTIGAGDELETSADGRAAFRLAGGASLRVDTQSRVQLLGGSVLALREGAVYVNTAPEGDAASPIEIRTPLGTVTEVGTQFEVRLEGDSMRLRVREGMVDLKRGSGTLRTEAGRELLAGAGSEVVTNPVSLHGEAWRWTLEVAPSFDLEGRSLEEFLTWLTRETGWRVRFEEASIAGRAPSLILHGSIEGLKPDEAPAAVLPTCGLRHRLENGILIIHQGGAS